MVGKHDAAIEEYVRQLDHTELQVAGESILNQIFENRESFPLLDPIPDDKLPGSIRKTKPIAVTYEQGYLYIQYARPFIGLVVGSKNKTPPRGEPLQLGINFYRERSN